MHAQRGEVISSVIVVIIVVIISTKIARSRDVGILASGQCCQDIISGEKAKIFFLLNEHKCYKACFLTAMAIDHTQ